jgi:hypothetical protein
MTRVGGGESVCSICMAALLRMAVTGQIASLPFFSASRYPDDPASTIPGRKAASGPVLRPDH